MVLCVDEKTQVQALDRTAPILALMPGTPQRRSHDYKRNGAANLFAALDTASGKVIASMTARRRAEEFRKFLNLIDKEIPEHLDVHIVLDNVSTHKTPAIKRRLLRHPRFTFHFTPTYSSWMNLVERWFSELTTKWIRRGSHTSVRDLQNSINARIDNQNNNPKPFTWHKTANQILDTLATYLQRISPLRTLGLGFEAGCPVSDRGRGCVEPRSRRPKTSPNATPPPTVGLIITTRRTLSEQGLDAGAETICWHLRHHHDVTVSASTIRRVLHRANLIEPAPKKRPKTSFIPFRGVAAQRECGKPTCATGASKRHRCGDLDFHRRPLALRAQRHRP